MKYNEFIAKNKIRTNFVEYQGIYTIVRNIIKKFLNVDNTREISKLILPIIPNSLQPLLKKQELVICTRF